MYLIPYFLCKQNLAWEIYLAIDKHTKANSGYSRIGHVDQVPATLEDFQER
jgi:hypothetical protein